MERTEKIETLQMFKKLPPIVRKAIAVGEKLAELKDQSEQKPAQPSPHPSAVHFTPIEDSEE